MITGLLTNFVAALLKLDWKGVGSKTAAPEFLQPQIADGKSSISTDN